MKAKLTMAALAIACASAAGCSAAGGGSSTTQQAAAANPCQSLSAWKSGGGTSGMNSIASDLTKVQSAGSAENMSEVVSAGQALDNDAQSAALDVPPIDGLDFTNAMADFQTAGTDLAMGTQSGITASETPLTSGSKEFEDFAASVKSTCG
jgi:hypothetical protein